MTAAIVGKMNRFYYTNSGNLENGLLNRGLNIGLVTLYYYCPSEKVASISEILLVYKSIS